jgi:acetyltransferase-like isoleucine patch superfamily enzyme
MKIFIIGAGTLGKLIVEIIESINEFEVGGFYDDNFPELKSVMAYPVLGRVGDLANSGKLSLAIGIGEPKYRKSIFEELSAQGHHFPALSHSSSVLSKYSLIEDGVLIGPNSSVLTGSRVQKGTCILSHVNINQDVQIEAFCLIGAGVIIGNNAKLGEACHIGLGQRVYLNEEIAAGTFRK